VVAVVLGDEGLGPRDGAGDDLERHPEGEVMELLAERVPVRPWAMSMDWLNTLTQLLQERDEAWRQGDAARAADLTEQIKPLTVKLEAMKANMLASKASPSPSPRSKWKWRRG
jgi:hypothetical protein